MRRRSHETVQRCCGISWGARQMSMTDLIHGWRKEAARHRSAQAECDIGDEEYFLNKIEAERLEKCAYELERAITGLAQISPDHEADLIELTDGHLELDRFGAAREDHGVELAICERVNELGQRAVAQV